VVQAQNRQAIAREFWKGTGIETFYPRNIEKAAALKLPLALVKLPRVTVSMIQRWLEKRHLHIRVPNDQRDLMGCLVAYRGFGIAFIAGTDSAEEQRLTVAHEIGHFLQDYFLPRLKLLAELGDEVAEVLDGKRTPTPYERVNAVLAHLRLGAHVHLLPRDGGDEEAEPAVAAAEEGADALGLELVAPRGQIFSYLRIASKSSSTITIEEKCILLGEKFGLPPPVFQRLVFPPERHRSISFIEGIRSTLRMNREGMN
jgi:hypothetical protein